MTWLVQIVVQKVGQAGHREVLKYSPLAALQQSNTCHNDVADRRAFLLWQSGLRPPGHEYTLRCFHA